MSVVSWQPPVPGPDGGQRSRTVESTLSENGHVGFKKFLQ